jgi:hypothetical protein
LPQDGSLHAGRKLSEVINEVWGFFLKSSLFANQQFLNWERGMQTKSIISTQSSNHSDNKYVYHAHSNITNKARIAV